MHSQMCSEVLCHYGREWKGIIAQRREGILIGEEQNSSWKLGMMIDTSNPSIQELRWKDREFKDSPPKLNGEFDESLDYIARSCPK